MAKYVELRRHTDNADDTLSPDGVRSALEIGTTLHGGYELLVSTGAQRATQTLACFLSALGQKVPGGVEVEEGLRSQVEERWKAAYQAAGSGELDALRSADPELVDQDSSVLAVALRRVLIGSPMVLGLSSSATAPRTRQRSSASPATSSGRWRRATVYFS